ncbi:sigma-70 family RNA polymerase sigma factor [Marilutibacter alkalisoli]|uniref:Sigma-70 family RNA polymerase sigma factor n=1 Tax=Marilutibacter alkalisoli TaxID=2591633 RepID=A0A514BRW5_9GAMM|nr:sigma-70 family RNA polymerase sigma factor [Lysobacter alkalisoli]QDH70138.1 sigma-70 family RNA polymerase sigma factor [Lysobacter alkalisoli]
MEMSVAEAELWHRYRAHGDMNARDSLFAQHVGWAKGIAWNVRRRIVAASVDGDDFVQNATIGLLEAMSRYDPQRGIPFRAYATRRVRGSVFNGIRAILGDRRAAPEEGRFASRLDHLQESGVESSLDYVIESVVGLGLGFLLESVQASVVDRQDGLAYAQSMELGDHLRSAVDSLPDRLKFIIQAHYFNHIPFNDIAAMWGITKGRISQLHRSALEKLRVELGGD